MKRLLFLIIPILLAWCSSIESQVSKQVQESNASVERQAELIKVATAEKIKQENIAKAWQEYLKALGWNIPDDTINPPQEWISNEGKPIVEAKVGYWKCIMNDDQETLIEWEIDYANYTRNDNCNFFAWTSICFENSKWKCLIFDDEQKYNLWIAHSEQ